MADIRIVNEDDLEAVDCEECGSGNILTSPDTCTSCATWREMIQYHRAHKAAIELKRYGSMFDLMVTMVARVRVTLTSENLMSYTTGDPLYDQANKIDHEISEMLDMLMAAGIDVAPARV